MEQIKTLEELREMHGEELKEYLLTLPLAERRRIIKELLEARAAEEEQLPDHPTDTTP